MFASKQLITAIYCTAKPPEINIHDLENFRGRNYTYAPIQQS